MADRRANKRPSGSSPDTDASPSDWRDPVYGVGSTPGTDNPVLLSVIWKARHLRRVAEAAHAAGHDWREAIS